MFLTSIFFQLQNNHRCTQGRRLKFERVSHTSAIKHEKKDTPPPPTFSDKPKHPPQKNFAKTPRGPTHALPPEFTTSVHLRKYTTNNSDREASE
jgi:hypothetical protein